MNVCPRCSAEVVSGFSSCLACETPLGYRPAARQQPLSPSPRFSETGRVALHTGSPLADTDHRVVAAVGNSRVAAHHHDDSPTARTLRRDLDVANRAIADLWVQAFHFGGAGGPHPNDVARLLEDEVSVRMSTALEMRADLLSSLSTSLATCRSFSVTRTEMEAARHDAITAMVGRADAVRSSDARADEAEKRCATLQAELRLERQAVAALEAELREIRSSKALQEVLASTDRERLHFELQDARTQFFTAERRLKSLGH